MYCKKCGKFIGNEDADICQECLAKEEVKTEPVAEIIEQKGSRTTGLPKAIASGCLTIGSIIFIYIALFFSLVSLGAMLVFTVMSIAMGIIAIVFGAKSIATFKRESRENRIKPIPTLIIGIASLATSSILVFVFFFAFFITTLLTL
jgi:hypothetical protein